MKNTSKYLRQEASNFSTEWAKKKYITSTPEWCSIDLMEGNRVFAESMTLYEKEEYFKLLTKIGFKEISLGNPAFHRSDAEFINSLIIKRLIPEDVTAHIYVNPEPEKVSRTMEALPGLKKIVLNLRSTVLMKSENDYPAFKEDLFNSVKYIIEKKKTIPGKSITVEVSLDIFRESDAEKALIIFNELSELLNPHEDNPVIFNLASAGGYIMPNVFASIFEYISLNLKNRDDIILSFRPCNDCGIAVSTAIMTLLAGVQRIEGTLFGAGEKAGNLDLVILAMNLYSNGIDPKLDFSDIPMICEKFERFTGIHVYDKRPFSGDSSFLVLSASHKAEISEAMKKREADGNEKWDIPYLVIDPRDVGRGLDYDAITSEKIPGKKRINNVLSKKYGLQIPVNLKSELARTIITAEDGQSDLDPEEIYRCFKSIYVNNTPVFTCPESYYIREENKTETVIRLSSGNSFTVRSDGNGRLDAVSNAFKKYFDVEFDIDIYEEHALTTGSKSKAVSYVCVKSGVETHWGVGIDEDIFKSSVDALTVAVNKIKKVINFSIDADPRLIEMLAFIRENFDTVTLGAVAEKFYLSQQYVSKYIKEKSGMTFCENVQSFRMKKAEELLRTTVLSIEAVAEQSGYPSVEHFNRKFKKLHGVTPVQFRKKKM